MAKKKLKKIKRKINKLKYPKLNALKFGLAGGILSGACIFLTTLAGVYGWFGGFQIWNSIILDIYGFIGYSKTWGGSILGAIYGFADGFVFTALFAWIYNKLL
ncbi:hypothetical protein ACFL0X_02440 [Nanoarchaeota archaeon]